MKRFYLILCLSNWAAVGWSGVGAPGDRFLGGSYDGHAVARFVSFVPSSSPRFAGGAYDGYGRAEKIRFTDPGSQPRFTGGRYDGYARSFFASFIVSGPLPRSTGGGYDGYSRASLTQFATPGPLPRFAGGWHDGADASRINGVHNPLADDTDGDGIPDWWEALYYWSITAVAGADDTDGDGVGARGEYVADTNPLDIGSFLTIVSIVVSNNQTDITFTCSSNRLYDLLVSTNLLVGTWIDLPGHTNLPGSVTGRITRQQPVNEAKKYFRVQVRIP